MDSMIGKIAAHALDLKGADDHASQQAGSSGNAELFTTVLGMLNDKKESAAKEDIDEDDAVVQHKKYFGGEDDGSSADDKSLGSAAAMQALKMFSGGESGSSSSDQKAFIGMAMAEASKLYDQKSSAGQVSSDSSKESAVMKAGEMALKMYLKSGGTGDQAPGPSGLMGLASKFLSK